MFRHFFIVIAFSLLSHFLAAQVVVSDEQGAVPSSQDVIFEVKTGSQEQFSVLRDSSVKVTGLLEADSAIIHGPLTITSNGGSFNFAPNVTFPSPIHDLTRLSTRRYSIMGGMILGIPFPPWSVWISTSLLAMGVNTQTPNNMLDVNGGDIDVNTPTFGYMIGDNYVLRHKGNTSNLYAGVNAGFANSTGNDLTVVGFDAASQGTNLGIQNTFVGSAAGRNVGTGGGLTNDYTFVGFQAGLNNTFGVANTFIGSQAGLSEMGDENVYVGWLAGANNGNISHHNTFVGNVSGLNNQTGSNNTFIGIGSGINNINGSNNIALGASASPGGPGLFNTVAIGVNATVPASDQMILGDNSMRVGIGLNADVTGPQNKLEIDAGLNGMSPVLAGNTGASGLRFRDLHSATLTVPNPGPGVLSVDALGDVIYVPASTVASGVSICSTPPPPFNNVMKLVAANTLCETNITDLFPANNVGINNIAPNDALDVGLGNSSGHIDINNAASAYKIDDQEILWHRGNITNLYVGINAAPANAVGNDNTVVGYDAAALATNLGINNTLVGSGAGYNLGSAFGTNDYTFVGYQAGYSNLGGSTNTFIGSQAGFSEMGDENVYVGWLSGFNSNNASYHNTFVGNVSGQSNQTGSNNTFIGIGTAFQNITGNNNICLGAGAGMGPGRTNLNNAISIGSGVYTMNSNQMLLGDNTMRVGIGLNLDVTGPQNKLEIDAGLNGMNPVLAGSTGASGLRFRDLHDLTLPSANPNNVFLSVDGNGDVILVGPAAGGGTGDNGLSQSGPTPGNVHLGQSLGAIGDPAQLLDDREIPMYGYHVYFNGDAGGSAGINERVDIGDNTLYPITATTGTRLNVQSRNQHTAATFISESSAAVNATESFAAKGLKFLAQSITSAGLYGHCEMDPNFTPIPGTTPVAIGVKGTAQNRALMWSGTNGNAYGVWGEAMDNLTGYNFGGYFIALNASGNNYAVYGDAGGFSNGTPGNPAGPTYAGYFNGDVYISGLYGPSDVKLKKNISPMEGALDLVMNLKPRTYEYRQGEFPGMSLPYGKQYGLIAQEVESVIPEIVMDNVQPAESEIEFKSIAYQELIPVLIKAIQEQQAQIVQQQLQIDALRAELGK